MKRIWRVEIDDRTFHFDDYNVAIQAVKDAYPHRTNFPPESQTTENTVLGFSTGNGGWVAIRALPLYSTPIKLKR